MKDILKFLRELSQNNNREWFIANKERYDNINRRVKELTQQLINRLVTIDPSAAVLSPEKCTYRIYRDIRFSSDKTPYKTHIGIFINPPRGKKSLRLGHYFHIEPGNIFFAAGTLPLPSPVIKNIRKAIYDNIDEYLEIVMDDNFRSLFPIVGENPLKTFPKGFPKDWEYMDLIRPRDFVACSEKFREDLSLEALPDLLTPYFQQAHRFNQFHNFTIDEYESKM